MFRRRRWRSPVVQSGDFVLYSRQLHYSFTNNKPSNEYKAGGNRQLEFMLDISWQCSRLLRTQSYRITQTLSIFIINLRMLFSTLTVRRRMAQGPKSGLLFDR